eukprot:scaffold5222_cov282-Chaetoceros_neogracile.AAC.19
MATDKEPCTVARVMAHNTMYLSVYLVRRPKCVSFAHMCFFNQSCSVVMTAKCEFAIADDDSSYISRGRLCFWSLAFSCDKYS